MSEQRMHIDDAKATLKQMEKEMLTLCPHSESPAEREHKIWLQLQIDTYATAIRKFEAENNA